MEREYEQFLGVLHASVQLKDALWGRQRLSVASLLRQCEAGSFIVGSHCSTMTSYYNSFPEFFTGYSRNILLHQIDSRDVRQCGFHRPPFKDNDTRRQTTGTQDTVRTRKCRHHNQEVTSHPFHLPGEDASTGNKNILQTFQKQKQRICS